MRMHPRKESIVLLQYAYPYVSYAYPYVPDIVLPEGGLFIPNDASVIQDSIIAYTLSLIAASTT